MIIDADTHLSNIREGNTIMVEELLKRMEKSKVDKSLVWLQPPYMREIDELNAYIYRVSKQYPDKILPFGWVDPNLGVEKARNMVKKCIYEYGFYGIKLNGAQNNFFIDDPKKSLPVVEEVAQTGKLLAFHIGADAIEQTHPYRVAKIAKMYPEIKILMAHMGGAAIPDLSESAIEFAQKCSNLYLIGSAVNYESILKAIKILGADRVCFGSDTPFRLMHVEVAAYNALLDGEVTEEDKAKIMGENIIRLFGLS